jgi:DNA-binding MarR family transcriptional regulator
MLNGLHQRGYDDLVAAHLSVLLYPGPDGMRPSDIAARMRMSKQAVAYLLGQLEQLDYLTRSADPDDQRSRRIWLTPRGHALAASIREIVGEVEREWTDRLGHRRFGELKEMLAELGDAP